MNLTARHVRGLSPASWLAPLIAPAPVIAIASIGSDDEPHAPPPDQPQRPAEHAAADPDASEPSAGPPPADGGDVVADGQWKRLERTWIIVERIGGLITLLILGGLVSLGMSLALFFHWIDGWWRWAAIAGWIALLTWLLWYAIWYPPLAYRYARYRITQRGMEIRRGVLWRSIINVPHSRVQHTDVTQGPVERHYGLGTLLLHTAGTQNHTVDLPGLSHQRAMRIRDYLLEEGGGELSRDESTANEATEPSAPESMPSDGAEGSQAVRERE